MAYTQKQGRDPLPKTGKGITDALLKGAGSAAAKAVAKSSKPTNSMRHPTMVKEYPSKKEGKLKRVHTGIKSISRKLEVKEIRPAKARGIKNISKKL
jgi:hypothetical protein